MKRIKLLYIARSLSLSFVHLEHMLYLYINVVSMWLIVKTLNKFQQQTKILNVLFLQ